MRSNTLDATIRTLSRGAGRLGAALQTPGPLLAGRPPVLMRLPRSAAPQVGLGWVYAITKNKTVEQLANK